MLLVRTFPLSLTIFWPFSFALVVWTTFYLVVMYLAFLLMAGLRITYGDWPVIGSLFQFALPLSFLMIAHVISIHLYLTGIKIGLTSLKIETERSETKLFVAACAYGVLEAILALALFTVMTGFYAFSQIQTPIYISLQYPSLTDPIAEMSRSIVFAPVTPVLPIFIGILLIMLRAALLPVLAGTVVGRAPSGRLHEPFGGFGQNFVRLFLLMILIMAISILVTPFLGSASQYIGLTTTITDQAGITFIRFMGGAEEFRLSFTYALSVLGAVCISIWLFSLQCAGAALAYRDQVGQFVTRAQTEASKRRLEAHSEAGDLLRSRMPKF